MRSPVQAIGFVAACVAAHALHIGWERVGHDDASDTSPVLPSAEALIWLSAGHRNIVADYYWLKTLEHFGNIDNHRAGYPLAAPLITRVLTLDPYFNEGYLFAGTALTLRDATVPDSNALLRQGLEYRPDEWQIPYYLGFNLFYFTHDYAEAADVLARAARSSDAPPVVGQLATRIASKADRPEIGLQLLDDMLQRTKDPQLKAAYEERRKSLLMELQVDQLTHAAATFTHEAGRAPTSVDELAAKLGLARPLLDPYGAPYELRADGSVHSANDDKRLRVYQDNQQ